MSDWNIPLDDSQIPPERGRHAGASSSRPAPAAAGARGAAPRAPVQSGGFRDRAEQARPDQGSYPAASRAPVQGGFAGERRDTADARRAPAQSGGYRDRAEQAGPAQSAYPSAPRTAGEGGDRSAAAESPNYTKTQYKVFGRAAALNAERSVTRGGVSTVVFEGANAVGDGTKEFRWTEKVAIQLTRHELPAALAVLLGIGDVQKVTFKSHGPQKNKSMTIHVQDRAVFISLSEGGKPPKPVPVPFQDAYQLGLFVLVAFCENYPGLTSDTVLSLLPAMVARGGLAPFAAG